LGIDTREVPVVLVGAGDHVVAAAQGLVDVDRDPADAHCAEAPGKGTQGFSDFLRLGWAGFSAAGGIQQLLLLEVVVATDDGQRLRPADDVGRRLGLTLGGGDAGVGFGEGGDGAYPRRGETLDGLCLVTVVYLRDA